jgi:diphthamide synthase subunit DPH2
MLACPYGILLDEKKFYKPVISMVEAEMALNGNREDGGNLCWTAEYQKILES